MEHYFTNNESLKSELRTIPYNFKDYTFCFTSDKGVFAKSKIDYGSRLLVETILEKAEYDGKQILDVGCGYGFIGIVLGKIYRSRVLLVDVNKRAVHLSKINLKNNQVEGDTIVSNTYENVSDTYDLIVTNPPIRAGKKTVLKILIDAKKYLKKDAFLWFVIRKDQGAKSIMKELEEIYQVTVEAKDKGFYIMKAKSS